MFRKRVSADCLIVESVPGVGLQTAVELFLGDICESMWLS